jgi:16S rRNA (uracil1498-N3)-methyltransferase
MRQFLIPRLPEPGAGIELRGDDFHYLYRVRRVRTGQVITLKSADGRSLEARVALCGADFLRLEATGNQAVALAAGAQEIQGVVPLHLVQGIPKGKKLEMVVRQATEIGVASITPLKCRNSVAELDERWDRKRQHLEGVIREAFQQSGGSRLPVLNDPLEPVVLADGLAPSAGGLVLFLHEQELAQSPLHGYLEPRPASVTLVVGPEGGFSPEEVRLFLQRGFRSAWLGPQVLRTETAAIVGLGVLSVLLRDSHSVDRKKHERIPKPRCPEGAPAGHTSRLHRFR